MALEDVLWAEDVSSLHATDLRLVSEAIPHIVWLAEPDGFRDYFNQRAVAFTGLQAASLLGRGWLQAVHPDDRFRAERTCVVAHARQRSYESEHRVRRFDGEYRRMLIRGVPIRNSLGEVFRWIGTWTDVEDERRLTDELREVNDRAAVSRARNDAALAAMPWVYLVVDSELRVRLMSRPFATFATAAPDDLGRPLAELIPAVWPEVEANYRRVLETGETIRDLPVTRVWPDGTVRHALNTYYPVTLDRAVIGVGLVSTDVTDLKRAHGLRATILDHMAEGLFAVDDDGRVTLFNRAAERLLGWAEPDVLGRRAHDLWHRMRADGTPLADSEWESPDVDAGPIWVEDSFARRDGTLLPVAFSAGAIEHPDGARGAVVVFRDTSDEQSAMARAQRNLDALQWVGRIRDALDEHRMVLYSQPIVPLNPAQAESEELLLRMRNPAGDLVLPGAFLPVAERYGLIADIDRWVIHRAAEVAAQGRRVEANVSAWTVANVDLLPDIERALARTGAAPGNLVLEITETAFMRNFDRAEAFARGLARIGCPLALDDFGTGFSGFTYLKRLPVTYLKIDLEFVRDLLANPANQRVIEAIVALAKGLDKLTVAEGVEDEACLEVLRALGVDYAQGYLFGQPAPVEQRGALTLW